MTRQPYDGGVRHYLDYAATSPLRPVARAAWLSVSERVGNPSSLHTSGRAARGIVEDARERIAAALGAHPTEVVLTSGGTEADNIGVTGAYWARREASPHHTTIVTTSIEHHAALDPARWLARNHGARCVEVGVDAHGSLDLQHYADAVAAAAGELAVVSVQWVNNEVGTVQPLTEVVNIAERYGVPVHTDAVQGIGHLPFDFAGSGCTSVAVSGHKVGGPVGVGVLLARRNAPLVPVMRGGGQERRLRSGTVDAASAWAFAVALDEAVGELSHESERLAQLGARIERAILAAAPDAVVHSPAREAQAPHIVHAIIEPSHVVEAMGYDAVAAAQTLRLSMGWGTTDEDIAALEAALATAIERARATRAAS